jgi:hypothetical protein
MFVYSKNGDQSVTGVLSEIQLVSLKGKSADQIKACRNVWLRFVDPLNIGISCIFPKVTWLRLVLYPAPPTKKEHFKRNVSEVFPRNVEAFIKYNFIIFKMYALEVNVGMPDYRKTLHVEIFKNQS